MDSVDDFIRSPWCILLLAASAFTSVIGAPQSDEWLQLGVWAGAFLWPALVYLQIRRMPSREAEGAGVFARYPGFATAAFFLVETAAVYRWFPGAMSQDTIVGVLGLYLLFAILTIAQLRPQTR